MTGAGVPMDADAAERISAWYRGKELLSTAVAMIPLNVYEWLPNDAGRQVARSHPLYDVLHRKPNGWQDSFQFRRQAMRHLIDHGSAYSLIVPGARGVVDQLWPIHPSRVTPEQVSSGRIVYHVRDEKTQQVRKYSQDEIFRVMGASDDGVTSKGILQSARESLGVAAAIERYASNTFGRGTINGGVITVPTKLDDDASKRMAKSFVTAAGDWALPKVLEQGASWVPNEMSPEDFQMLVSRKFTVDEMARWLGLPRMMLENSDPSFGNAEQFNQNLVTYSLGPWLSMWEFACSDQLVVNTSRFYVEFNRDAFARGDLATRWEAHVKAVNAGIKSVDEVRDVENLNRRGGKADELREPQNITGKAAVPTEQPPSRRPPPDAQAMAIATESAVRMLRKEAKALKALSVRHAADQDAFASGVSEFYAKHAQMVRETLAIAEDRAVDYCASQAALVVEGGIAVVEGWDMAAHAEWLATWALDAPGVDDNEV